MPKANRTARQKTAAINNLIKARAAARRRAAAPHMLKGRSVYKGVQAAKIKRTDPVRSRMMGRNAQALLKASRGAKPTGKRGRIAIHPVTGTTSIKRG